MPKKPKPKTQAQLDAAANTRLLKTYGISLDEYNELAASNLWGCWICNRTAGTRRLHVDHDHSWKKVVIVSEKTIARTAWQAWSAWAEYNGVTYSEWADKKSLAVKGVKQQLLRASVRGLLCYSDNAGLQKFSDSPDRLRAAADYLENFAAGKSSKILEGK